MKKDLKFYFFALGAYGSGISGGDRIFIEFARRWGKEIPIYLYLWTEGFEMCQRNNLKAPKLHFKISSMEPWKKFGFLINYVARIFEGIKIGLTIEMDNSSQNVIYSASEFWMDTLPAILIKLRYPKVRWLASWYQTAPNPIVGFAEGQREKTYKFSSSLYWLVQLPIKPFVTHTADFVIVNNESERKYFPKNMNMIVLLGAVDIEKTNFWKKRLGSTQKIYDAVFQGRFHPQKGVIELVEIWAKVVKKLPEAHLAMIGDGPLMHSVKLKIEELGLSKNIDLLGYLFDGKEKYTVFSQSKLVVHPAFFDSGGMASAEAMAFGLPCVGFDLKSYESYYPQGMIKVKIGDLDSFAREIIKLIKNKKQRESLGLIAQKMIEKNWSWNERTKRVLTHLIS